MVDMYRSRCGATSELRERHDPIIYGRWNPQAPLTQRQVEFYERNGYLILKNVFIDDEVKRLQEEAQSLIADPAAMNQETIITESGGNEVRSIFAIHQQNTLFARLAADQRLAGIARFLLDDIPYIHQSRLNYKPGFAGKEFYWHSDFETWHVEDGMPQMRALSMSVLLADNNENNGPLLLIPGSHAIYITCVGETPEEHYRTSLRKQEYGVPDCDSLRHLASMHGIEAMTGEAGTVVMFDCNIMHGSNSNITPFPRSNAFFVYNACSNALVEPFGPKTQRPAFVADRSFEPLCIVDGTLTE